MDKITRYLILLFICVVFFALAPLIVIYVSGKGLNFGDSEQGTGILDVQTEPSSAQVFLNGKLSDTTPTTIRFVKQGTYDIEIKKDGYHSWLKKLFIEGGKVTYAGTLDDMIKLLPESNPVAISDQKIKTALIVNNQVVFVSDTNSVSVYDLGQKKVTTQIVLPITTKITKLTSTQNQNILFAYTEDGKLYLLDANTLKLTPLPNQINGSKNIELMADNVLAFQQGNDLYSYNTVSKSVPKIILKDIQGFTSNKNLIYVATNTILATYFWNGKTLAKQNVLYDGTVPSGKTVNLYLTSHKELFLQADHSLYRINTVPELFSSQVESVNFNANRQELTFTTPTEIYFYNFSSGQTELFHRSSQALTQAFVVPELGYGFVTTDKEVSAIEIDNRNGQNQYTLYNMTPASMMQLSDDENQLVILADQKLYSIIVN